MTHVLDSRSTMSGFAKRTLTNLLFVSSTQNKSQVHIVTQIITSMLGLLIFPQQYLCKLSGDATARTHFNSAIAKAKTEGWPDWRKWTFDPAMKKARDTEGNLDCLLKHLRNSLAHYHIEFSPVEHVDSRDPAKVTVEFFDGPPKAQHYNWHASINGEDLRKFIIRLAEHLDSALP